MPIYEYVCDECETQFQRIVLNKTQEIACPKCGGQKNTRSSSRCLPRQLEAAIVLPRNPPAADFPAVADVVAAVAAAAESPFEVCFD